MQVRKDNYLSIVNILTPPAINRGNADVLLQTEAIVRKVFCSLLSVYNKKTNIVIIRTRISVFHPCKVWVLCSCFWTHPMMSCWSLFQDVCYQLSMVLGNFRKMEMVWHIYAKHLRRDICLASWICCFYFSITNWTQLLEYLIYANVALKSIHFPPLVISFSPEK